MNELLKAVTDMGAGSGKSVSRKQDGTIILIQCVYLEDACSEEFLKDLEELEEKHGMGV